MDVTYTADDPLKWRVELGDPGRLRLEFNTFAWKDATALSLQTDIGKLMFRQNSFYNVYVAERIEIAGI